MSGRALQGQADEGDGNAVELPDLVGREDGLAGILSRRWRRQGSETLRRETDAAPGICRSDGSRHSASAAVRPCPRRTHDCRPRQSRAPSSTSIRWSARRGTSPTESGLAPIRSPAATKIVLLWPSRSCLTSVAMCSAPPAATVIFLVLSSGSAIPIPPGGGRRLPWKSLMARIRRLDRRGLSCGARGRVKRDRQRRGRKDLTKRMSHDISLPSWPGFVPAIHVLPALVLDKDVDAPRYKAGHDERCYKAPFH